ncbi:MAG: hypothetical protein KGI40_07250 [Xanthomonadaceae bacterium]|nr:hypothetical protein [Xanthomonadaceae bacterium]MDE1958863.1 hypothetical protein [Xanthomonadaceae bacterium]MDE2178812.1 hypothetical protein [Xanthomonadaceae bacterium]
MPLTLIALLCLVLMVVALSIKRIPEGQVYSLHRLGRPARLLTPGTHMVLPLLERVAHKISLTGRTLRLDETLAQGGAAARAVRATLYWQVLDPARAENMIEGADALLQARARSVLLGIDPQAPVGERNAVLKRTLNAAVEAHGLLVTRIDTELD